MKTTEDIVADIISEQIGIGKNQISPDLVRNPVRRRLERHQKHVPETIAKLEDSGMLDQFLRDHSTVGEDGETYVDMDSVFDELYLEPDKLLKKYTKGG